MAFCELCNSSTEEARYGVLVDVADWEVSQWSFNIISIKYVQKLCLRCCQNLRLVGELLFQWRDTVNVNLASAKPPVSNSYSASRAYGENVEEAYILNQFLKASDQTVEKPQHNALDVKDENAEAGDGWVSDDDMNYEQ